MRASRRGLDVTGGSALGMAFPISTKYAPQMIMLARRPPVGSSTRPYACASVIARGMIIISAPKTTPLFTVARVRANPAFTTSASCRKSESVSPRPCFMYWVTFDERRKANWKPCRTATMTRNIAMAAVHAQAAAGLAFQLASASAIPRMGNADAACERIQLNAMSGFSFDRPPGHLTLIDASRPLRFQTPPERLGETEQRLLQDRHHQPVDDRPSGFLRVDQPRLLQHGEMG